MLKFDYRQISKTSVSSRNEISTKMDLFIQFQISNHVYTDMNKPFKDHNNLNVFDILINTQ